MSDVLHGNGQRKKASPARVYAHFLGSRDTYEVDREAAQKVIDAAPDTPAVARANYEFAGRAAAYGVMQLSKRPHRGPIRVLNIGCGIDDDVRPPTLGDQVHSATPDALLINVDNDPEVLTHARAAQRLGHGKVLEGDVRDLDKLFNGPDLRALIDLNEPMVIVLAAVLHFVDDPARIMADLRNWVPPGSILVLSHATTTDVDRDRVEAMTNAYDTATSSITFRPEEEILALTKGWRLIRPPGSQEQPGTSDRCLVDVAQWGRPQPDNDQHKPSVRVVGLVAELEGEGR
ncbi:SAM-dependent methyltransferase [Spirillospora sp. NPDC000708]